MGISADVPNITQHMAPNAPSGSAQHDPSQRQLSTDGLVKYQAGYFMGMDPGTKNIPVMSKLAPLTRTYLEWWLTSSFRLNGQQKRQDH